MVIKATVVVPIFYASLPTCSNLCCLETPVRGNFYCLSSLRLGGCNYLLVMKSQLLMTLPADDCLSFSAHACLWSLSVMSIHTIVQSELLLFTACELIHIFLVFLALWSLLVIVAFWRQVICCWLWAHALFPMITSSRFWFSCSFEFSIHLNYCTGVMWTQVGCMRAWRRSTAKVIVFLLWKFI